VDLFSGFGGVKRAAGKCYAVCMVGKFVFKKMRNGIIVLTSNLQIN
jgi:hypothetical protein